MRSARHSKGFTLIEMLIYLALYSIIIFGAVAAVYGIFESTARNQTAAMVEEEGAYLISKIDWALESASLVSIPAVSTSGAQLTIQNYDGATLTFASSGESMSIKNGDYATELLNNANTSIIDLSFAHTSASQNGLYPEELSASFTIVATTSEGSALSRSFSTVKYIRK